MKREKDRLTRPEIDKAAVGATLEDGGGLRLVIGSTSRKWVFRFVSPVTKKRREMGLGLHPSTSLKKAREKAETLRDEVKHGRDPLEARQQETQRERDEKEARERE